MEKAQHFKAVVAPAGSGFGSHQKKINKKPAYNSLQPSSMANGTLF